MKPVLFQFGSWQVASYPAMLAVGACLLVWLAVRTAGRDLLPCRHVALLLVTAFYAGLAGARALFVLEHGAKLAEPLSALLSPVPGGLASSGGLIVGCLAAAVYCRLVRLPFVRAADSAAVGLCLFGVSARLGCFLAGCCHGKPAPEALGVIFPLGSPASARWGAGIAVHPAQLYEAAGLIAVAVLLHLRHGRRGFAGEQFLLLAAAYSAIRFLNDFLRGDTTLTMMGLTLPQWISLAALLLSLALLEEPRFRARRLATKEGSS